MLTLEYSRFVYGVGSGISWLESVFEGLIDTVLDNWLLSGFLYCCIAFTAICIVIDFIQDFTDSTNEFMIFTVRKENREAERELKYKQRMSENQKKYEERRKENRAYAEQLYRQRETERRKYNESLYNNRKYTVEHNNSSDNKKHKIAYRFIDGKGVFVDETTGIVLGDIHTYKP